MPPRWTQRARDARVLVCYLAREGQSPIKGSKERQKLWDTTELPDVERQGRNERVSHVPDVREGLKSQ